MDPITQYIFDLVISKGLVIAASAYVLAEIAKSTERIPMKYISLICAVFGIVIAIFMPYIFPDVPWGERGLWGMLLGWAATGGFETFKNLWRDKSTKEG